MTLSVGAYVKGGVELDQIAVEGIRVTGYHGVLATERESGQLFIADIVAHVSTQAAATTDQLARTVNYSDLADAVAEVLAGDPSDLLETVAEHCARAVLEFEGVECVDVAIHKPQAPLHVEFADVIVRIRRDLRSGTLWADKRIGSSAGMSDDPLEQPAIFRDAFDERPFQPVTAWIALGGNLGEVERTLRAAVRELDRVSGIHVVATSALVKSAPVGGPEQPDYLNAVVQIETALAPRELLAACQGVEVVHGRERSVVNGPRTLDLDIISIAGVTGESADLVLPHPRAHERAFVLVPLGDVDADAVLPGANGGAVSDLLARVDVESVSVVAKPWPSGAEPTPLGTDAVPVVDGPDFT
ncbi:2-amino-4-hydroxy-6-hydroxymethyldihydropteridine diphosphokinase [Demequina sp.]|uniref:2-amino-4-hydroxy-6- hydroxymethyldihydropteridine diphosphokinase n=1 Tax=Demequina sp. TaxID=2050685 RepID=UPI003D0D579A